MLSVNEDFDVERMEMPQEPQDGSAVHLRLRHFPREPFLIVVLVPVFLLVFLPVFLLVLLPQHQQQGATSLARLWF